MANDLIVRVAADLTAFKANMKLMDSQIDTTAAAMKAMSKAFDPSKIIADGNAAVIQVQKMGGAAVLSQQAQEKLNVRLKETIDQYQRLGKEAPEAMRELYEATKKVEQAAGAVAAPAQNMGEKVKGAWTSVQGFVGALGIGLGIGAVTSFARSIFDAAGTAGDLAARLGTTAEFAQRMAYVADQSGSSIDTFGGAIGKMNVLLSAGDSSTVEALRAAGLQFAQIRAMKPEDAFYAIADGIQGIADPMRQAELAVRLFGKAGQEMLPAIKDGIKNVGDQAAVMSDETVKRIKAAEDTWKGWWNSVVVGSAEMIVAFDTTAERNRKLKAELQNNPQVELESLSLWMKNFSAGQKFNNPLSQSAGPQAPAFDVGKYIADHARKADEAASALARYTAQVKALREEYSGAKLALEVKAHAEALEKEGGIAKRTAYNLQELGKQAAKWREQGALLTPQLTMLANAQTHNAQTVQVLGNQWDEAGISIQESRLWLEKLPTEFDLTTSSIKELLKYTPSLKGGLDPGQIPIDRVKEMRGAVDKLMQSLTQLATIAGDTFSGWVRSAATAIASVRALNDAIDAGKKVLDGWRDMTAKAKGNAIGLGIVVSSVAWIFKSFANTISETKQQQKDAAEAWKKWQTEGAAREAETMAQAIAMVDDLKIGWEELSAAARDNKIDASVLAIVQNLNHLQLAGVNSAAAIRTQADAVNTLLGNIAASGGTITPALMPIIEQMTELGLVSEEAMRKVMGLAQNPKPVDWKAMEQAAGKYGIALNKLGPQFQQSKLNDTFAALAADFDLLKYGGADMSEVLVKMGPQINTAVSDSLKFGATIPAAMKPMIEAAMNAGQLFDENGKKLTDMGKLNFATPIEDSMKELVKLFKDFLDKIKQSSDYLNRMPKEVNVDVIYNDNKGGIGGGGAAEAADAAGAAFGGLVTNSGVQYLARGGMAKLLAFRPRGTDTVPAMLTPGEGVVNRTGMASLGVSGLTALNHGQPLAATGTDGGTMHLELKFQDGRTIADLVVPFIPGAVKRYGLR